MRTSLAAFGSSVRQCLCVSPTHRNAWCVGRDQRPHCRLIRIQARLAPPPRATAARHRAVVHGAAPLRLERATTSRGAAMNFPYIAEAEVKSRDPR